jgi:hypothetical protein
MSKHFTIRCAVIIVCVIFLFSGPLATGVHAQQGGSFMYSRNSDGVILQFSQEIGMLENTDPTPILTVYGDGRVNVHFPVFMKKAGDYRMQFTTQELSSLLTSMIEKGVMEFDVNTAKAMKKNAARQRREAAKSRGETPELLHHSDGETIVIEIHLDQYRPSGNSGPMRENVRKKISWHGLRRDAEQNPGIASLKGVADAARELEELVEHKDLKKINP